MICERRCTSNNVGEQLTRNEISLRAWEGNSALDCDGGKDEGEELVHVSLVVWDRLTLR